MMSESTNFYTAKKRSEFYQAIRTYFFEHFALEVETPVLSHYAATDLHLDSYVVSSPITTNKNKYYLQTSPEFFMKRLLAEGSGDIYQICKVFRADETGKRHNPEFNMLEWYRLDYSLSELMYEVAELLKSLSAKFDLPVDLITYREAFIKYLDINPFTATIEVLLSLIDKHIEGAPQLDNIDDCLNLLLTACIEPKLGQGKLTFLYQYPASQAALAKKINNEYGDWVAERFELYYQGIELANGFDELTDANEQQQRFIDDNKERKAAGKVELPYDENLIAALSKGMPKCAGVALGLDRVFMLAESKQSIDEVLLFSFTKA